MESHIGYEKHSQNEKDSDKRRNGNYEKTLIDPEGRKLTVEVPRDRDGEFEPQLIPKGVRKFEGFDDKVISLYARGMTIREIQGHLEELYATKVSSELISKVTDGIVEDVTVNLKEQQVATIEAVITLKSERKCNGRSIFTQP